MTGTDLPQGWTWEDVLDRLGEYADLEESAREHRAIVRVRVIKTGAQLLRLVLAYVLSGLSLRSTVAWAEAAGAASFSDVALLKRLKQCGPWLAHLASTLAAAAHPEASAGRDGRRVVAVDATAITSPGGQHKPYRVLHTVYDIGAQRFRTTEVTDRSVAERLDVGRVEKGEIRLGDRLYGRYRDLAAVTAAGADYVVRLSANALRLETLKGEPFDRAALCRRAEREGVQEAAVSVADPAGRPPLAARVIVVPLPPEKAEAARRQMRKKGRKAGYTPSAEALATAGCVMVITSLPAADWPAERVLDLYRQRWQVELAFKRLKSLLDLERLRAFDSELVSAWIHAVLVVALLIDLARPSAQTEGPDSPRSAPDDARSPFGAFSPSSLAA
jgi:Transposase DDE domain